MDIVVDASAIGSLLLQDEADRVPFLDETMPEAHLVVPPVWAIEVANMIVVAERRRRITAIDARHALKLAADLRAEADVQSLAAAFGATADLARQHGLSLYDASYLELARRRDLALVTLDRQLVAAARASDVVVHTAP